MGSISASQNGTLGFGINTAYSFSLSDVPNANEFTGLYDQYMISSVKVVFRPLVNQLVGGQPNMGTTAFVGYPAFHTVLDYDDAIAPGNLATMLQYQTLRMSNSNRTHTRVLRPKFSTKTFQSTIIDAFRPATGFIDATYPTVPHYGMKVFMEAPAVVAGTSSSCTYQVYATYTLKFKNVR